MLLEEVEVLYGIRYPELFREIYLSGAMQWMTSGVWLKAHYDALYETPEAFLFNDVSADCEPLLFEAVPDRVEFINKMNAISGYKLKQEYFFLPFAKEGGGDLFCFVYENRTKLVQILHYAHDCDVLVSYGDDFEEFLFWTLANAVTGWDTEPDDPALHAHAAYLNPQHRALFDEIDSDVLTNVLQNFEKKWDVSDVELLMRYYDTIEKK